MSAGVLNLPPKDDTALPVEVVAQRLQAPLDAVIAACAGLPVHAGSRFALSDLQRTFPDVRWSA